MFQWKKWRFRSVFFHAYVCFHQMGMIMVVELLQPTISKRLPMHVDRKKIPKNSHRPKYMIIYEIQQSSAWMGSIKRPTNKRTPSLFPWEDMYLFQNGSRASSVLPKKNLVTQEQYTLSGHDREGWVKVRRNILYFNILCTLYTCTIREGVKLFGGFLRSKWYSPSPPLPGQ